MAIKLHRKGIALSRDERIKEDENLSMIENELNKVGAALPEAQAAKVLSEEAKAQAEGVQTQLNEIVVNGDSSVEAAQARVRSDGTVAATLKERLDTEHQEVAVKLAETDDFVNGGKTFPTIMPHPYVQNPVLTGASVTDRVAQGVADPFICYENGMYHMFFEVISASNGEEVGHAYSPDGLKWTYTQVVISETGQHFAYPFVIKHNGKWYMLPDKGNNWDVYEATSFPLEWRKLKTLINAPIVDGTLFQFKNVWYMHAKVGTEVRLYVCNGDWLTGSWSQHPQSPILKNQYDRGAGNPFVYADCVVLPMQGYITSYGDYAQWYKLSNLTPTTVRVDKGEMFINGQSNGQWNSRGMHHLGHVEELGNRIMVVDGLGVANSNDWSIGIYTEGTDRNIRGRASLYSYQTISEVNTWTRINIGQGSPARQYNTLYLFNLADRDFTIPVSGYYKMKLQVTEYGAIGYRHIRSRIYNKTKEVEICNSNLSVPAGGTSAQHNTLNCETVLWFDKGDKVGADFRTSHANFLLAGSQHTFFEVEKVD